MIRALIVGELRDDPQQRTTKTGNPFAIARLTVPMGDAGRVTCSVVAFETEAVRRLLQLRAGASVAVAGVLKVATWQTRVGEVKPSLDVVADEVAATTPRPRKPKATLGGREQPGGDPFGDLPGAGDLDWMGA